MESPNAIVISPTPSSPPPDVRIILNVGGIRHETTQQVLRKIPATRLSKLTPNLANYDPMLNEYFFDRHPGVFISILNYYRTGKLHHPTDVCGPLFEDELAYWGLDADQVEPCCWMTYTQHKLLQAQEEFPGYRDTAEILAAIETLDVDTSMKTDEEVAREFGWVEDYRNGSLSRWQQTKPTVWRLLDEPWSSGAARMVQVLSLAVVFLSVTEFCLKTHHWFRVPKLVGIEQTLGNWTGGNLSGTSLLDLQNFTEHNRSQFMMKVGASEPVSALYYIEHLCNAWLAIELIARFSFCPNKRKQLRSVMTVIDFIVTLTFYLEKGVAYLRLFDASRDALRMLSILRILRLFKLTEHSRGLKIIMQTFRASASELLMLVFIMSMFTVVFAALMYYAERIVGGRDTMFHSIPEALWWAIITLCTIGYGDYVPKTYFGMAVGALCALTSVIVASLPVPMIVDNFTMFYTHSHARSKMPKEKLRVLNLAELINREKMAKKLIGTNATGRRASFSGTTRNRQAF